MELFKVVVVLPCPHINLSEKAIVTMGHIKLSSVSIQLPTPSAPSIEKPSYATDQASLMDNQENIATTGAVFFYYYYYYSSGLENVGYHSDIWRNNWEK